MSITVVCYEIMFFFVCFFATRGFRGSQQPVPHLTSGKRQMACSHGMLVELHTGVILEKVTRNIKNTYVKCMI